MGNLTGLQKDKWKTLPKCSPGDTSICHVIDRELFVSSRTNWETLHQWFFGLGCLVLLIVLQKGRCFQEHTQGRFPSKMPPAELLPVVLFHGDL